LLRLIGYGSAIEELLKRWISSHFCSPHSRNWAVLEMGEAPTVGRGGRTMCAGYALRAGLLPTCSSSPRPPSSPHPLLPSPPPPGLITPSSPASLLLFCSVVVITLGAVVAGLRDLSFEPYASGLVFLANLATAIYLATIARIQVSPEASTPGGS